MEISDLEKQVEKQGIKKGNPVELTVSSDNSFNPREWRYKTIGYFEKVEYKAHYLKNNEPELIIKDKKNNTHLGGPEGSNTPLGFFKVSDIFKIRKL